MDLSLLDDADLRRVFGVPTLERAADYVERDRVLLDAWEVDEDGDVVVEGRAKGSQGAWYSTVVSVGLGRRGAWSTSRCTCPVRSGCKHAAALVLMARGRQRADSPGSSPLWERRLGALLEELDDSDGSEPRLPLALEVATVGASGQRARFSWGEDVRPGRGPLRLRPLRQGKRGTWVRTGVSWGDLRHADEHGYDAAHADVLGEIDAAHRAASRQMYFGGESHLPLGAFGPSLWSLLHRAVAAGVELVPGQDIAEVRLAESPAMLEVDLNADSDGARVRVRARLGPEWYDATDLDVLGERGHGVALWSRPGPDPDAAETRPVVTLAALARPAGPQLRRLLQDQRDLRVPSDQGDALVHDYVPRLQRHLGVVSSDGSLSIAPSAPARLVLTVTWVSADEAALRWTWRYRVGEDDRVYGLAETRGLRGVRRLEEERTLRDRLGRLTREHEPGWLLHLDGRRDESLAPERTLHGGDAVDLAELVLPLLLDDGTVEVEEVGGRPDYRAAESAPVVRFSPMASTDPAEDALHRPDWLDLDVVVTVDGHHVGLGTVLAALTGGRTRIVLGNGLHVDVDVPALRRLAALVAAARELVEQPSDGLAVRRPDLGLWDELAEIGLVEGQAATFVEAARGLVLPATLPEVDVPGLRATLRSYQAEGLRWLAFLWRSRLGGILADDMGLGKTLQTLALVALARSEGAGPFLVVAPTSVVSTWVAEAARFVPDLTVRAVEGTHARRGVPLTDLHDGADLVVTSYTLLRLESDGYADLAWGGLVLDEAQTVKNHQGKTHQAVRRLEVPFRLALSGTPMENRLMELWSLVSIVAPGLYPWPDRFREQVADPVEKEGDDRVLAAFRRRIAPFLLRRTKDVVAADLPPKQEQVLTVPLTPRHREVYDTHLQRERQHVLGLVEEGFDRHRVAIFSSLTRLRQLALDAALVDERYAGIGSAKVDVLADHLVEVLAEGHRALVFSQFTSFLTRVRDRLDAEGVTSTYLDGSTRDRGAVVREFTEGEAGVFLISLKAGGVGLTLTEADYVFVLDPWWNPAVEAQAVDRAHRIGQQRPVMVYRLVSEDTVEEKVMQLKARKAALFARVVDGTGGTGTPLDEADVRALLE